ncbi:MAG: DUF1553 domain-containing protein [Roseibacillus sp.]|jgi:mono/diheme cytochrome c family protein|nr:hypothetical protein [Roseibacillus sp.]MCP4728451.1 DUF1553 domain-containing protein [Roseibacillus sp.]MDP7308469.1 DUF1553 domain-containing protein [Roseibacillus sp.]HJM62949.1 DUF1553 domain-containing protein [Roseibacillus sp.]|tara:strand:+ start:1310 stop:4483 length:3174 start_codon:yes stop_codon:yes gene_type:complete
MISSIPKSTSTLTVLLLGVTIGNAAPDPIRISYSKDIQPLLSDKCFKCHGNDPSTRKAKLRLDKAEFAFAPRPDGDPQPIVKGNPIESEIMHLIRSEDEDEVMPPPKTRKTLSTAEIDLIERWIVEGADYEEHWAFSPPVRSTPPTAKNKTWPRNTIDHFILARLEAAGLEPNAEADRRTLIRRVSFDLTGLPPSPDAVEAFVNDPLPTNKVYARLVETLLSSPHYGEHRARYWLDAARYGDTHGLHLDNYREIWPYRDWVIKAFNSNMPFDQFTIEQLAGDLLPSPTLDQRVATGFIRCNVTTSEGGAIAEEYNAIYAKDRVATMTRVWMGLNADCASCHDHKFDPLTMRDFYQLSAFFRNSTQKAMDGNAKDTPPNIFVPARADRKRWFALDDESASLQKQLANREANAMPDFMEWQNDDAQRKPVGTDDLVIHLPINEGEGRSLKDSEDHPYPIVEKVAWVDGFTGKAVQFTGNSYVELGDLGDFERDQAFSYGAWLKTPARGNGAAVARMDRDDGHRGWDLWLQDSRVAMHLIYTWPENYLKVLTKKPLSTNKWTHVFVTYDGSSKAAGVKIYFDGAPQDVEVEGDFLGNTIRTTTSLKLGRRNTGQGFTNGGLHDFRLYQRELKPDEVRRLAKGGVITDLLAIEQPKRTSKQNETILRYYLEQEDTSYRILKDRIAALESERAAIRKRGATTLVMQEKPSKPFAHILKRGEYDQPQEKVFPGTPAAMLPMPKDAPANRLGLARWLMEPDHPLTARVSVNQLWQQVMGTGIVETAGDFGTMGQRPSHPDLLNWLAVEFRESGWDMKHVLRLIVSSAAYRQDSSSTPRKINLDAANRLLSRGPRFRLDGEMIRDQALAASGLLVRDLGGPSVKPYQPSGVWFAVGYTRSNTARFVQDHEDKLYRRSLYTFWKRTAAPPSLEVFNAPSRESCTVQRDRTNTPLQALTLMNDPQFIEAARHLATNAINACGNDHRARLNHITSRVLARTFDDEEHTLIEQSLQKFRTCFQKDPPAATDLVSIGETKADPAIPAPELATWIMIASQILNFDETITKN